MDDNITIRRLKKGEGSVLDNVLEDTFDNPIDPVQAAAFLDSATHDIVIALNGDLVVGLASGVAQLHPDKAPIYFVQEVGVHDDWQRRGIGRRLSEALMAVARKRGCDGIWLATETKNTAARALYKSMGGRETKKIVVYDWGGVMDD